MVCPPVRGDNPRALARGLSPVHADNHGTCITILYYTTCISVDRALQITRCFVLWSKWVWSGKYNSHTLQTNRRYREEEPQNNNSHKTPGNATSPPPPPLSLPHQDDCKTRKDTKQWACTIKHGTNTEPTMRATINNERWQGWYKVH